MASFVKLAKGAGQALRRMQEEMAAKAIEEKLVFPDAPGALQLYHGSPHAFDAFDFEANLRRGEGAMAFGPGGYMTGNRPLAEHYARGLSQRHLSGTQNKRPSPLGPYEVPVHNAGALNRYFLDAPDVGRGLVRNADGELETARFVLPYHTRRGSYKLSMDGTLDPYEGTVRAKPSGAGHYTGQLAFPPGAKFAANKAGTSSYANPHGTLSGMLKEDKNATLRYLQYKEMQRLIDNDVLGLDFDGSLVSTLKEVKPGAGVRHYLEALQEADFPRYPPSTRSNGAFGMSHRDMPNWRLHGKNSDWALRVGEDLHKALDPHADVGLRVDRPRNPPVRRPEGGPAPWLYTADFGAGPNDMALYDMLLKDQSSRVQGALTELLLAKPHPSLDKLVDSYKDDLGAIPVSSIVRDAVPNDLSGMMMLKEAGVPATAFLRAGPRAGGVGLKFNPDDYNFVIHDQGKLSNVRREKIK